MGSPSGRKTAMARKPVANVSHQRLRKLVDAHRFDECLEEFARVERQRLLLPNELVQKGRCVQLSDSEEGSLQDAEEAFRRALDLDSDYVPALLELGWYYYAVEDDAPTALGFFKRALAVIKEYLKEARQGQEECLSEIRELETSDEA